EISSFMVFRQSTVWRWSHARHHSDTIIRGRDPEISMKRPPRYKRIIMGIAGLGGAIPEIKNILLHATGRIDKEVATYVPEEEFPMVIFKARIYVLIYSLVIFLSVYYGTILPLMFIGLPTVFGGWLMRLYGWTQHAGLQENVLDHRLNSRTIYMNRMHRFLYWNMNYHVEHHMFPLVPYHALPKLHELIKDDCPEPSRGLYGAYKEIIPAVLRQMKDPCYFVEKKLPRKRPAIPVVKEDVFIGDTSDIRNGKIKVCKVSDLPKGTVVRFDFDQRTYAVYHTEKDNFYATDGICTHGNAHLADGIIINETIECQKHNGRFDLKDGSPRRKPVCIAVKSYKVLVKEEEVFLDLSERSSTGVKENARSFSVVSNNNLSSFIKELVLKPEDGKPFSFDPGQYVQLLIPPHKTRFDRFKISEPFSFTWQDQGLFDLWSESKVHIKRNYSLAVDPAKEQNLKFNVRIALPPKTMNVSAGSGSSYIFSLKPGDIIKLNGPFGDFLPKDTGREMIYIGGGAGMAPIRSHLSNLLETQDTDRKISFWYGARTMQELFYQDYFVGLQNKKPNFSFNAALSGPDIEKEWNGSTGFIHKCLMDEYLENHPYPQEIEYYLCGPPAMIRAAKDMLENLGVPEQMIAFDEF
ncbi:MAG: NADH:ubiquinone reductase (Na(+)-transporting) subunit F, partial [Bacteroidota bacterium]